MLLSILNIFSLILSTIYAFWLMNRILFGQIILFSFKLIIKYRNLNCNIVQLKRYWTNNLVDTTQREHFILAPLIIISFFCGIITDFPIHTLFLPLIINFYINLI